MATDERILQIERGIVCSMEKQIRQMLAQKEHERDTATHRAAMDRKYQIVEARRKEENAVKVEEHEARAAESIIRKQRVLARREEDRQIAHAVEIEKQERAIVKHERILEERETVVERHRAEGEAKREYIRQVKGQLDVIQQERKDEVWARIKAHEMRRVRVQEQKIVQVEEHHRIEVMKDLKTAEKREAFKREQEEIKQLVQASLQKKHDQSARMRQKKEADLLGLMKVKEDLEVKKREMHALMQEAERTGNMQKVNEAMEELIAHKEKLEVSAHEEWASRNTVRSPNRRRAQSTTSSSVTSPQSPQSPARRKDKALSNPAPPSGNGPLTRSSSAPRLQRETSQTEVRRSQTPPPQRSVSSPAQQEDLLAPGSHYEHLMGLFKAQLASERRHVKY